MGSGVAVVSQLHALNNDGGSVNDDPLLGVVVKHPFASLHGTARSGMHARADGA